MVRNARSEGHQNLTLCCFHTASRVYLMVPIIGSFPALASGPPAMQLRDPSQGVWDSGTHSMTFYDQAMDVHLVAGHKFAEAHL